MFLHLLHTVECLIDLSVTLETEGDGDDTHRQDTQFLRDTGDDRGSTGTCATTHTGGDEGHAGAVAEHAADILEALFSCLTGFLGLVAGTESLFSKLEVYRDG